MNHQLSTMLYVHVPFCSSKCGYCAFHSIPKPGDDIIASYFKKLEKDFEREKKNAGKLESLFIGGGTPGYLSPTNLERLFTLIQNNFSISEKAEISIECNPESLTKEKIKIIEGFANRVSLGIQSFNEAHRKILGRAGDMRNVYESIEILNNSKINNISCDIIYGIPSQNVKDFEADIRTVVSYKIFTHFSAYSLTFEENSEITSLYSEDEKDDFETVSAEMWELIPEIIKNTGFKRYEISNYSLKGKECKHNVDTWFGGKYLGFGPAASSFDGNVRWTQRELSEWLRGEPAIYDRISEKERMNEIFMMGLRTVFGWEIKPEMSDNNRPQTVGQFKIIGPYKNNSYSVSSSYVEDLKEKLLSLKSSGLLDVLNFDAGGFGVVPTEKGLTFWNEIALQLV